MYAALLLGPYDSIHSDPMGPEVSVAGRDAALSGPYRGVTVQAFKILEQASAIRGFE